MHFNVYDYINFLDVFVLCVVRVFVYYKVGDIPKPWNERAPPHPMAPTLSQTRGCHGIEEPPTLKNPH